MNILTDRLPDKLDINGVGYPVYTDFKVWIKAAVMLEGSERGAYLLPKLLKLCLMPCNGKPFPEPGGFFAAFLDFYLCGEKPAEAKEKKGKRRPALFSYEYDAELIYAAFMAQYGIDLRAASLHWWEFKALFDGLCGEHKLCKIMEYRSADLSKIKDNSHRAYIRRMQRIYALPDNRSEEEKDADIARALLQ